MQLNTKPKRGQKFIIIDTGEEITLNRIKENGEYFCDYQNGNFDSFSPEDLKLVTKGKRHISKSPKKLTEKEKSDKQLMNDFFDGLDCPPYCENCNAPLIAYTTFGKRSCCAHIVPKSIIESVKMHPANIMFLGAGYLGGCDCHGQFDSSIKARKAMKIFPIALRRFELFKDDLTPTELITAMEYLGIPLTKEILNHIK